MLKSKRDKRERVKHPCSICSKAVGDKNGLQCQGACKRWVHFSCMNYSPSKIRDIQNGKIEITCPCPNCDNQTRIRKTCDKAECPANKLKFLDRKRKPIPDLLKQNEVQHMSETIHEEPKPKCCKHNAKRSSHHELSPILKRSPLPSQTRPVKFKDSVSDEPDSPRQHRKSHSLRPLQIPLPLDLQSGSPQKYIEPPYYPHKRHHHQHHRTLDTSPTQSPQPQQQFQQSHMQSPESPTSESQEKSLEEQLALHQHHECPPEIQHYPIPKPSDPLDSIFPTQDLRQPQHHWAATKMSHNELYNLQNRPKDSESISYESTIRLDAEETLPPIVLENQQNEQQTGQWTLNGEYLENSSQNEASQQTLNDSYSLKQNEVDVISEQVMEPQLKHQISMYTSYPDVLTSLSASHLKPLAPHYHIQQDNNQPQAGQTPYQQPIDQQMGGMNPNLLRNCYLPMQYPLPILVPHTINQQQQILDHIQQQQIAQSNQQQHNSQPQQKKQQVSEANQQNQKTQQSSQSKQHQPQKKQQPSKSQQQQQQTPQPQPQTSQPQPQTSLPQPQIPHSHQQHLHQQPYHQIQIPYQIPQYQQQNPQLHRLPQQQQILIRQPIYQQPLYDPRLPQYVQIPQYAQPYPHYQIPQTPPPQYQRIPTIQQKTYPQLPYVQLIPQNQQMQPQMYQKHYRNTCEPTQLLSQCNDNRKSQEFHNRHNTPSFVASPGMNVVTGLSDEVLIQRIPLSLGTSNAPTAAATPIPPATPNPNITAVPMSPGPMTPLTPISPTSLVSPITPRTRQTPRSPATLGSRRDDVSMKTMSNRTNHSRQETLTSLSMSCLSICENNLKPVNPSKSDSQVSFPSDRRRVLISAMEQMYETMGQFHTQFRDLMCRMMTIFEDRP